ncbi:MAG: DoxX family protein [Saprospiraceae bacterium]|nr:DoxX family protein [Saprospiraceae bacterium]
MSQFHHFVNQITKPISLPFWWMECLHYFPRFIGGLLLAIDFGASKFGMPWSTTPDLALFHVPQWFVKDVAEFGMPFNIMPQFFAWMGAASETLGGICLVLGFQTRIAGTFIGLTMLVALIFQKWGQGTWEMLPAMGFLWISIYSIILGSGRIGLDHLLYRKLQKN